MKGILAPDSSRSRNVDSQ